MEEVRELVCARCAQVYPDGAVCPKHPDEPLLDISDRQVRLFLLQDDDKAAGRYMMYWIVPCFLAGIVLGCVAAWIWNSWIAPEINPYHAFDSDARTRPYVYMMIGGGAVGGSLGAFLGKKLFKPRWRRFTENLGSGT